MRRRRKLTAQLFQSLGVPAWMLYTLMLHVWAVLVGAKVTGTGAAILTALLPVISWCYWAVSLPGEFEPVADLFVPNLLSWLVSTSLVYAAWRANRRR